MTLLIINYQQYWDFANIWLKILTPNVFGKVTGVIIVCIVVKPFQ
jgi:hypothetical protein